MYIFVLQISNYTILCIVLGQIHFFFKAISLLIYNNMHILTHIRHNIMLLFYIVMLGTFQLQNFIKLFTCDRVD